MFGVCCEPLSRQVFFQVMTRQSRSARVLVSLLPPAQTRGEGVMLQADNCIGQNKNTTMMWYLAWRVITGQHDRIELNFMLPGHTKFRPDSYFGLFKKHYHRQDHVDNMADLADCVQQCGQNVTSVPQLCKDWWFYDWNAFLGQWFGPLVGLGRCHTFVFDREHPNVTKGKLMPADCNQDATELNILKSGVTIQATLDAYQRLVMPPVLMPSGLSAQRSQYLYDKVREYVRDPRKKDDVCPKPSLAITMSNAAENVCPQDQPGPSTAIHGPSTAKGHKSNDEDKGRKRRPNSELNFVYRCPMCTKSYASYPAL